MRKISVLLVVLSFLFCGTIFGAEGDVLWTRTYDSPGAGDDIGWGIAVDGSGNVYVTGYEEVAGEEDNIWVRKYTSGGDVVWTRTYNGADDGDDIGYGIAVDGSGNVYVTGYETVSGEGGNIWVRKYDSDGDVVWTRTYNGAANSWDEGSSIAVDRSGNVYVTGYEESGAANDRDIWVRKYNSNGQEVWARTHNGPGSDDDEGYGIAVDGSGNVYVAGCEWGVGEEDIWVRKYTSGGDEVWTRTYNGTASQNDQGYDIAVDGSGNVYVIGYEIVAGESRNIWIRKYNSEGDEVWTTTHNGIFDGWDEGYGIAVDGSGNVYVTGCHQVSGASLEIWVRKYDSDGKEVWTRSHNGDGERSGFDIAVDGSGNVYVAGADWDPVKGCSIWVRKYEGAFGENFQPPQESDVKIQGGEKGYVNPKKGEVAKIHFQPEGSGTVNVKIYTLRGLLVWQESKSVSEYQDYIEWDCRNKENDRVASGIYVVYVEGPGIKTTKKLAILK